MLTLKNAEQTSWTSEYVIFCRVKPVYSQLSMGLNDPVAVLEN